MRARLLVDSGAEWRRILTYSTQRQAGSGKKEAADCIKDSISFAIG